MPVVGVPFWHWLPQLPIKRVDDVDLKSHLEVWVAFVDLDTANDTGAKVFCAISFLNYDAEDDVLPDELVESLWDIKL